ncbi:MAG: sulfotransferase [Bacteroidia bacterium]|nr:sulfotransferase [Bacteroidia bacterium]NND26504.1 sulfotransferase [Flavobacteriaceae bacterium]NNE15753.1 sulfotransferase [Saprospiraceae bacterium]
MIESSHSSWISDEPEKLPDFIIGGAMKSGTTTLHTILHKHPDIDMAHEELGFFDMDNLDQHPDFSFEDLKTGALVTQDLTKDPELFWNWYYSKFTNKQGCLKGEDSTTYLASPIAAERIAMQKKPIKLIFILRHPTQRSISNYKHLLKSGRATRNLERTLRDEPEKIIKRSQYKEQLEVYYDQIPAHLIKVVLFEDFIEDPQKIIKELCEFLNVDFQKYSEADLNVHSNKTKLPRSEFLQLKRNKILNYFGNYRYVNFLPNKPSEQKRIPFSHKLINKIHSWINPKDFHYGIKTKPETIAYLDAYFKKELEGIDTIVQKEIYSKWFQ